MAKVMAQAKTSKVKQKKKVKKNVAAGIAHIQSTFNNTIVTITDVNGNAVGVVERWRARLQGLAQVDAVRRAARRRGGRSQARRSTACAPSPCS